MRHWVVFFAAFLSFSLAIWNASACYGGGTPENMILVVNAESASSMKIANHYIKWRKIPPQNVVYLKGIPKKQYMTIIEFRDKIFKPLVAQIEKRKLAAQVDYIVYSSGFPTRVFAFKDIELDPNAEKLKKNRLLTGYLSLNSATFYWQAVVQRKLGYLSLNGNWYMRQPTRSLFRKPIYGGDEESYQAALRQLQGKNYKQAAESFKSLAEKLDQNFVLWYQLARCQAQLGNAKQAVESLKKAAKLGSPTREYIAKDSLLAPIRDDADCRKVFQTFPAGAFEYLPSQGFRSRYAWQPNGIRASKGNVNRRYFLSTLLAVTTFPLVNSDEEALKYLKAAVDSDATKPRGKFYYSKTKDVRSTTRQRSFPNAVVELRRLGYTGEIYQTVLPKNKNDVIGLSIGRSRWDWASCNSKILPGAICENLTSYGGLLGDDKGQTTLVEFLRNGAAGSCGTVWEPYAVQAKFPHPMIHVHYARGCCLAEAFYQSVHGPFQLLIVGDPLCQPFASPPEFQVKGLKPNQEVKGEVEIDLTPVKEDSISHFELFSDGILRGRMEVGKKVRFDSSELSDGYHDIRIVAVSNDAIETRFRKILPIMVNNSQKFVKVTPATANIKSGKKLKLKLESTGAQAITVYQNGRKIDSLKKPSGEVEISSSLLGQGPTSIYAIAEIDGNKIASPPVEVTITR